MRASWMDPEAIRSVCRGAALLAAPTQDCPRLEEASSTQENLSASCTPHHSSPLALKVDPKVQARDFWASLHGQVPGLLDWDMGNECFLSFTTSHLPEAEQNREWGSGGGVRGRQQQHRVGGLPLASQARHLTGIRVSNPTQEWVWPLLQLSPQCPHGLSVFIPSPPTPPHTHTLQNIPRRWLNFGACAWELGMP